jgi:thiamine-monophosphate kinase
MRETSFIRSIRRFAELAPQNNQIVRGIGDDCAVLRPAGGLDYVFTTDFTIEDRHFTLATHTAADVGMKALVRSLSDLAAMGAEPVFCTVSLALPASLAAEWIRDFYGGLTQAAGEYNIAISGGDLAQSEKITVDVMCCGSVPQGRALLRSGARPGDLIYVTGELGGSCLGLEQKRGSAWERHKRPQARIAVGQVLIKLASAAMDLSDGLSLDLRRLCDESKVGAEILPTLPIAEGATLHHALHGGEDYELLFCARPETGVPSRIAGIPVTQIGRITGLCGAILYAGKSLEPLGFDHFR